MEDQFVSAINDKKKVRVTFYSKKDQKSVTRTCAPMDIGPHSSFPDRGDYFHVWDYDGASGPHPAPLKRDQIIDLETLSENFEPGDFVTWTPDWTVPRDWGVYS